MPTMNRKTDTFTESVIRMMTRRSDAAGAINLSQGFPDWDPPREIMEALAKISYEGPHQYPVTIGAASLRAALCEKQGKAIGRTLDPEEEIVITCGGTESMMCAMMTICEPGDKVMVFSPFYENYGADCILSGAEPIFIPLVPPAYDFDISLIEQGFRDGAKAIIICNPSNPCGKVFTREELTAIGELALRYDAFIVTDEVYEHIVYKPYEHICAAALPGMFDHVITCNSLSKTYAVTGWRIGYIIAPKYVIDEAKKVHDFLSLAAPGPLQEAAVTGVKFPPSYYEELRESYTEKRDYFLAGLDRAGLVHNVPQGAYFVMIDISEFMALPKFAGCSDQDFCEWMIDNVGVAAVPGSSFFNEEVNNLIRLHFAREIPVLEEVISRLMKMRSSEKNEAILEAVAESPVSKRGRRLQNR